jgi:hypothetical protein
MQMSKIICPHCGSDQAVSTPGEREAFYCWKEKGKGCMKYFSKPADADPVNRPAHYTAHPSGIECIQVTEHFGFNLGNAIKYIWRADLKADAVQDLEKAKWYLERELAKRKQAK